MIYLLKFKPSVFAIGDSYQIYVVASVPAVFSVIVGERTYYDASNGVLRSSSKIHCVTVPAKELDAAGEYSVLLEEVLSRRIAFSTIGRRELFRFSFSPLPTGRPVRIYHMADTHNGVELPVKAAAVYGSYDLLILNGDIPNHCDEESNIENIYCLTGQLTEGRIPILFSRGNHDMRGKFAEHYCDVTPTCRGKTYYTTRLGNLWFLVLDCGEDKVDGHPEYGGVNCCFSFRREETEFLKAVASHPETEYAAPGVTHRFVICHIPFTFVSENPEWAIERELYTGWANLLKETVRPDLMLCGHLHRSGISPVGGYLDHLGQPCTVIVGADVDKDHWRGAGILVENDRYTVEFTDSNGAKSAPTVLKKEG